MRDIPVMIEAETRGTTTRVKALRKRVPKTSTIE